MVGIWQTESRRCTSSSHGPKTRRVVGDNRTSMKGTRTMAKKQTRRSVSLNASTFERSKQAAARAGIPLSRFTERALEAFLAAIHDTVGGTAAAFNFPPPSSGVIPKLTQDG